MSKSVYVRVVHDFRIIMFFVVRSNDSFNFPLGLIKYIVTNKTCFRQDDVAARTHRDN